MFFRCLFTGNYASIGGAIATRDYPIELYLSLIMKNRAAYGGAVALLVGNRSEIFTGNIIMNNFAS